MKRITLPVVLALATVGLAGCGYSQGDHAVSGGRIGAGTGVIIGGLGGAAIGAFIDPNQVNLGRPARR